MELNYLYSGSCRYEVDGRQFELTQGDAILFDTEAIRSVPSEKGENDIVIATFLQEFFDSVFLASLPAATSSPRFSSRASAIGASATTPSSLPTSTPATYPTSSASRP